MGLSKNRYEKKILTETTEFMRLVWGQKYDPEKNFSTHPIVYISEQLIRTERSSGSGVTIEIDRRTLRMRYARSVPPDWYFSCKKLEKAF